jgi:hypothetical protein
MSVMFANADALSAVPVILVLLIAVVMLLSVRMACGVIGVALTKAVTRMLDVSIMAMFLFFVVLVIVRFRVIG